MAVRGAKPKPAALRLVGGTHRPHRHGDREEAARSTDAAVAAFGPLERPKGLKGHALVCWREMIEPAAWLDGSKRLAALALCELYAEWKPAPRMFPASKHAQMRAYMAELGLTDERNRGKQDKPAKDEFFDD